MLPEKPRSLEVTENREGLVRGPDLLSYEDTLRGVVGGDLGRAALV
jgi:hypothetical protein